MHNHKYNLIILRKNMKKVFKCLIVCLMGIAFVFAASSVITNASDSSDVNSNVKSLLTKYYNNGTYIKETQINLNEKAVSEGIKYFHAKTSKNVRTF